MSYSDRCAKFRFDAACGGGGTGIKLLASTVLYNHPASFSSYQGTNSTRPQNRISGSSHETSPWGHRRREEAGRREEERQGGEEGLRKEGRRRRIGDNETGLTPLRKKIMGEEWQGVPNVGKVSFYVL